MSDLATRDTTHHNVVPGVVFESHGVQGVQAWDKPPTANADLAMRTSLDTKTLAPGATPETERPARDAYLSFGDRKTLRELLGSRLQTRFGPPA
jgi:hypothetical protein